MDPSNLENLVISINREAIARLPFEDKLFKMAEKEVEEASRDVIANAAPNIETDLGQTLSQLKGKIVELDKELQEARKNNKKLEKRNKNFKDSIQKMIEEKRHVEELTKIIEEQNFKIQEQNLSIEVYKKQLDDLKSSQKIEIEMESKQVEQNATVPSSEQDDKLKIGEQSVLLKQVEILTFKNHELKTELDRRTIISDELRKEHETILKDRNELLSDVKTLKQQVEEMKQRLDRSLTLLSKKRTTKQNDSATSENATNSTRNTSKGILNRKEKSPTRTATVFQDRRTAGGRLILNSVGKTSQKEPCKRPRTNKSSLKENTSKIPVSTKEKTLQISKATDNLEDPPKMKGKTDDLTKAKTKTQAHRLEASGSIQEVIEKRVVTDIRAKLERNKTNQE